MLIQDKQKSYNQIIQAIKLAMAYTKDCLGATDAQMGNLRANNISALMVLQNSSEVPLENIRFDNPSTPPCGH